jgi:hypothetical protein
MDWESIGRQFEPKPMVRYLTSIDTAKGEARAYTATEGQAPKLHGIIDMPAGRREVKPNG